MQYYIGTIGIEHERVSDGGDGGERDRKETHNCEESE